MPACSASRTLLISSSIVLMNPACPTFGPARADQLLTRRRALRARGTALAGPQAGHPRLLRARRPAELLAVHGDVHRRVAGELAALPVAPAVLQLETGQLGHEV